MLVLTDRESAARLSDPVLRRLILQRIDALTEECPEHCLEQLQLRIAKNSGKGMFSPEALDLALSFDTWIRLRQVQRLGRASGKRVVALTCGALLHDRAASVVG